MGAESTMEGNHRRAEECLKKEKGGEARKEIGKLRGGRYRDVNQAAIKISEGFHAKRPGYIYPSASL